MCTNCQCVSNPAKHGWHFTGGAAAVAESHRVMSLIHLENVAQSIHSNEWYIRPSVKPWYFWMGIKYSQEIIATISSACKVWFHLTMSSFHPDSDPHFLLLSRHIKRIVQPRYLRVLSECFLVLFDSSSFIRPALCTAHCTVCSCRFCATGQQVQPLLSGLKIIKWHRRKWEWFEVYYTATKKKVWFPASIKIYGPWLEPFW